MSFPEDVAPKNQHIDCSLSKSSSAFSRLYKQVLASDIKSNMFEKISCCHVELKPFGYGWCLIQSEALDSESLGTCHYLRILAKFINIAFGYLNHVSVILLIILQAWSSKALHELR